MGISYSYNEIVDIGTIRCTNEDVCILFTKEIQNWDALRETLVEDLNLNFKDKIASKITLIKKIYLKDKIILSTHFPFGYLSKENSSFGDYPKRSYT